MRFWKLGVVVAVIGLAVAAAGFAALVRGIPPLDDMLTTADGRMTGPAARIDALPPFLIDALVAAEDRSFYEHPGIDPVAIVRAALVDLGAGRIVQGASTITEQLAKNLLPPEHSEIVKKLKEMILAVRLEHWFSKRQILDLYFNHVYFGEGAWGIEAATRRYFGKPAEQLTPFEAAMLVGLLPAPSRFNPIRHPSVARERARTVLDDMMDAGFLTDGQRRAVLAAAGQQQQAMP